MDWRSKRSWHLAGMVLTVIWLTGVTLRTGGDPSHPLFAYIFIVPLIGWLLLVAVTWLIERRRGPGDSAGSDEP